MAIGGNMARLNSTETKKKWRHFTTERGEVLLADYEQRLRSEGKSRSTREIQEDMAGDWACDIRTIQRNLIKAKRARQVRNPPLSKREVCSIIQDWGVHIRAPSIAEITHGTVIAGHHIKDESLLKYVWEEVFPESIRKTYSA